ncbi:MULTISPECIES: phage scaffolding protein [Enterococcus]|uniref:Phage scaffolding protein n=2 Tax=Enterococcus gallinarum TaxID=1353 RepID=A0ABD4HNE7_ENTGA|nr:phage scaffolding protein [Enterococcus gallinarum]MBF0824596.1 phage scaffolding protein [Enterococcus faecalis]DAM42201.1 MAG TPA: minor structural protein [Caudoviricetes sp.]MBA0948669.1 phage scaffolding protein [Enterococcus gallinarum]MBA0961701.1 phage scaffolding protein [Enterococcus gallinarum]MBA0969639.1 phage scaffolding protein [Enterococcus gallinarum]
MKREELKKLGLSDEQMDAVMAAHGQTVQSLNTQIATLQQSETELKNQVSKNAEDLKKLQKDNSDNEELKKQLKELQKENAAQEEKYQESLTKVQRDSALSALLAEAKVKNPKAVAALLDDEKIVFKDGELSGAKEQIESLQKSDAYLFDLGTKQGGYNPSAGQAATNYASFDEAMEKGDVDGFLRQQIESEENE